MPRANGRWGWRADLVGELLAHDTEGLLFFAGSSEEQVALPFDYRALLTAPPSVLITRLPSAAATTTDATMSSQVLTDLADVEPLLRRFADLILRSTGGPSRVADLLLSRIQGPDAVA